MRWKLLRRRLSVSAPRVIVRSHLPWPLRWAVAALVFGFSAALALWAFEFGKEIAGLQRNSEAEVTKLRQEIAQLREERERAVSVANTADSLLKTERVAQERLAAQVKTLEVQNLVLKRDLGFFERLLPSPGTTGVAVRGLQAEVAMPGQMRFQLLVMRQAKSTGDFNGKYEITLTGTLDGQPWAQALPGGPQPLGFRQYQRVEGVIDYPTVAVVKQLQVRVLDARGAMQASESVQL
jgi:hypothetical protein